MSTHRAIDRACCAALALALLVAVLFCNAERFGLQRSDAVQGYEARLFDTSRVHTVDIVMEDWEGFLEGCEDEEYVSCAVVIDGEAYKNVAIRAKGNTSLSSVKAYGNNRYSFKIEFDHYEAGNTYYGLDKLCLNNIIQDNTYLKDYLSYTLMKEFGVPSPLCSFAYITVNGEEWGLYIAVEALEDGFLTRNYGSSHGNLYKPDSMSNGGGRGNGGGFKMEDWENRENGGAEGMPQLPDGFPEGLGQGGDPSGSGGAEGMPQLPDGFPEGFEQGGNPSGSGSGASGQEGQMPDSGRHGGGPGGMGSSDVKLQYVDDDPDSYSNIFDNAKTDITDADKNRLIESLRKLSAGEEIESVVNTDEVIRYMVVHNFLCNDDSYTGQMVHNYYLYEEDGQLSMLPWDYNLAFGGFSGGFGGGGSASGATGTVNTPIDTLVSSGSQEDRPMAAWILNDETYTALYHQYYAEFVAALTEGGGLAGKIDEVSKLIAPFVEKDPTKFCTYEEFETGVETLREFCELRLESISGQLDGTIPSTSEGQRQDGAALVDASHIEVSDMGSMGHGGGPGGERPNGGPEEMQGGRTDAQQLGGGYPEGGTEAGTGTGAQQPESSAAAPAEGNGDPGTGDGMPGKDFSAAGQDGDAAQGAGSRNQRHMPGDFPGDPGQADGASGREQLLWLGVSCAVLLAGLGFAIRFRR